MHNNRCTPNLGSNYGRIWISTSDWSTDGLMRPRSTQSCLSYMKWIAQLNIHFNIYNPRAWIHSSLLFSWNFISPTQHHIHIYLHTIQCYTFPTGLRLSIPYSLRCVKCNPLVVNKITIYFPDHDNLHVIQLGSCWSWAQPMRDDVTM